MGFYLNFTVVETDKLPMRLLHCTSSFLLTILLSVTLNAKSIEEPAKYSVGQSVYLGNLEDDDDVLTVYSEPGKNWIRCNRDTVHEKKDNCVIKGWPNRDADIKIIDPAVVKKVVDPFSGQKVEEFFYRVDFKYTTTSSAGTKYIKEDTGYLPETVLTAKKYTPFYSKTLKELQSDIDNEVCPPTKNTVIKKPKEITELSKALNSKKFIAESTTIYESIGQCVIGNPTKAPTRFPAGNIFDSMVIPEINSSQKLDIYREDKEQVNTDDLINIDALARTLYGEMGGCFRNGLQYPMAVARIIVNRSEAKTKHGLFIKSTHVDGKPTLAKVATTPSQFNNWMKTDNENDLNGPLHHSLCPPKEVNKPFWKAQKASKEDVEVWNNAVRIATEAIIYPKKFKERTSDLDGIYFYTSDMGKFYNSKLITHKKINDRPIDSTRCIELWTEPTAVKKKKQRRRNN